MSQPTKRPAGKRVQTTVFPIVNAPMRAVLGLPFATPINFDHPAQIDSYGTRRRQRSFPNIIEMANWPNRGQGH
jgi:hypothetical protein